MLCDIQLRFNVQGVGKIRIEEYVALCHVDKGRSAH
jgi:hypothetical protein